MTPSGSFRAPTRVVAGSGALASLPTVLTDRACARPLVVADPGVEAARRAVDALAAHGVDAAVFDEVESNPRTTTAERCAERSREHRADAIVAIGGGSVLDCAKAAALLATNDGRATDWVGRREFDRAPLPFVAVPTTCGTGSEVTWVAVLTDEECRTKISVKGDALFPAVALVDPDLLATLPPALVASTGMDALTHAIEATTVNCRNPVSDALAEASIALVFEHLLAAVAASAPGGERTALHGMARASTIAGLAFGNADVGAVHCVSETIGGRHDLAHGLLNAVFLAPVLRAHGAAVEQRLGELDARLGGDGDPRSFIARVEHLAEDVGIPRFSALGVPAADDAAIARGAVENGSNASNPRPMGEADYAAILAAARAS